MKSKQILSGAIVLLVAMGGLSACGNNNGGTPASTAAATAAPAASSADTTAAPAASSAAAPSSGVDIWAKYDPGITVSTVKGFQDSYMSYPDKPADWNTENNPWSWALKDDFNITTKCLWEVASNQYEQKLNVAIAANQLPDIFQCNAVQFSKVVQMGVAQDMTQAYNDYISPFSKKYLDDGGMALKQATIGGKLMAIPNTNGNIDSSQVLWIRQDWLDKLNLKAPTTIDEFVNVAKAFTTQDPDGNGKNDTYGFSMQKEFMGTQGNSGALTGFFAAYHTNTIGFVQGADGKLVSGVTQPAVKDGLTVLADMYKNGYINPQFGVEDLTTMGNDLNAGTVGMFFGEHWNAFWPLGSAQGSNPNVVWRAVPLPSSDGKSPSIFLSGSASNYWVVNKSLKNPEAAVKILNEETRYNATASPDYKAVYHFGTSNPNNDQLPDSSKSGGGDMQLYQLSIIFSFTPTQNIDIFHNTKSVAEGTTIAPNSQPITMSDEEKALTKERWDTILSTGKVPATGRALDYTDYYGVKHNDPKVDVLWDPSQYGGYLWIYPYGAFWTIDSYMQNNLMIQPLFYGTPTATQTSKQATLDQLVLTDFTKIIMGESPVSDFDKFVSDYKSLGGEKIAQEVNDWYNANK